MDEESKSFQSDVGDGNLSSSKHIHRSKHDRYRRLEDKMDQMHQQVIDTQMLVRELMNFVQKQKEFPSESYTSTSINPRSSSMNMRASNAYTPAKRPSLALLLDDPAQVLLENKKRMTNEGSIVDHVLDNQVQDVRTIPIGPLSANTYSQQQKLSAITDDGNERQKVDTATEPKEEVRSSKNTLKVIRPITDKSSSFKQATQGLSAVVENFKRSTRSVMDQVQGRKKTMGARRFSISSIATAHNHPDDGQSTKSLQGKVKKTARWSRLMSRVNRGGSITPDDIESLRLTAKRIHGCSIRHDSQLRQYWDIFVIIMIAIDVFAEPLDVGFETHEFFVSIISATATTIFACDFVIHIFTTYTDTRGELVSDPVYTATHYLWSMGALIDLLSWFPFSVITSSKLGNVLGVAKIFRLSRLTRLARKLSSAKKAGVLRLVLLFGVILVVLHLCACYWNLVATVWRSQIVEWDELSLYEKYKKCWTVAVGCINSSPPLGEKSADEEVVIALFMLIGNALQATVFGSFAVLLSSFNQSEAEYHQKLMEVGERCQFLGISEGLSNRIKGFYENLYRETKSVRSDADAFINELSPALVCEIKFQLYRDMITQIPFLSARKIDPTVIEMLILHLQTIIYMQDDVLIRKGEYGDWMGFIGSKGIVGVLDPKSDVRRIIRILHRGDYFGEMALLQKSMRSTTAVALTWVQIHVLCRNDLNDVKTQYPGQGEILEEEINKYMQSKVQYK